MSRNKFSPFAFLILILFSTKVKCQSEQLFLIPKAEELILFPDNNTLAIQSSNSISVWSLNEQKMLWIDNCNSQSPFELIFNNDQSFIYGAGLLLDSANYCFLSKTDLSKGTSEFWGDRITNIREMVSFNEGKKSYLLDIYGYFSQVELDSSHNVKHNYNGTIQNQVLKIKRTFGGKLAYIDRGGQLGLLDTESDQLIKSIEFTQNKIENTIYTSFEMDLTTSTKGNHLITFDNKKFVLWDSNTLKKIREHNFNPSHPVFTGWKSIVKFSKDGMFYGFADPEQGIVEIYRTLSGLKVKEFKSRVTFKDFDIASNFDFFLLIMHNGEIKKILPSVKQNPKSVEEWNRSIINEDFLYVRAGRFDLLRIDLNSSEILNTVSGYLGVQGMRTADNPNELVSISKYGLSVTNFESQKPIKKQIEIIRKDGDDQLLFWVDQQLKEIAYFNERTRLLKKVTLKTNATIDSLYLNNIEDPIKIAFKENSNIAYIISKKEVLKYESKKPLRTLLKDVDCILISDSFNRNLVQIIADTISIYDLDEEKVVLKIPPNMMSPRFYDRNPKFTFSKSLRFAVIEDVYGFRKEIWDLKDNAIVKTFNDPRIVGIHLDKDNHIVIVYPDHFALENQLTKE